MKIKHKAVLWYNSLGRTKKDELARDYYGGELITCDEILEMYLEEEGSYSLKELVSVLKSFSAKFVANTETAYKEEEIREWVDKNLNS